jgi:hypothetical protein
VIALLLSVVAVAGCGALLWRSFARRDVVVEAAYRHLGLVGHPVVWGAALVGMVVFGSVRVHDGRAAEAAHAIGWALDGRAELRSAGIAYHKTDMLIRPAIVFDRRPRDAAMATFRSVALGDTLDGWIALDDDDAKDQRRGTQRVSIEARMQGAETWTSLLDRPLPHTPGRVDLSLPLRDLAGQVADVRVVVRSEGNRPPLVAFDLELGEPKA